VLDTGATFAALKSNFAIKAKVRRGVSVAVQPDSANAGGLLGMSLLSRFDAITDGKTMKVKRANAD
jgi:predicted aspartyl protease